MGKYGLSLEPDYLIQLRVHLDIQGHVLREMRQIV